MATRRNNVNDPRNVVSGEVSMDKSRKIMIIIFISFFLIIGVAVGIIWFNQSTSQQQDQNITIDEASGKTVVDPEGKVAESAVSGDPLIIGASLLFDKGLSKNHVTMIQQHLALFASDINASQISIYKDSISQKFSAGSPDTTVYFEVLADDTGSYAVTVTYTSTLIISSIAIKDTTNKVLYSESFSLD